MPLGLASLVLLDGLHDPPVPVFLAPFVDHLEQHVVQIVHRIDHVTDVGGLEGIHRLVPQGMDFARHARSVGGKRQVVDVVGGMERMRPPRPAFRRRPPAIGVH
jgi:hypothetical protein